MKVVVVTTVVFVSVVQLCVAVTVVVVFFIVVVVSLSFWGLAMRDFVDFADFSHKTKALWCPPAPGESILA